MCPQKENRLGAQSFRLACPEMMPMTVAYRCRHARVSTAYLKFISIPARPAVLDPWSVQGHLQPSCSVAIDGSLSPDSFRAGRMPMTEESGQFLTRASQQTESLFDPLVGARQQRADRKLPDRPHAETVHLFQGNGRRRPRGRHGPAMMDAASALESSCPAHRR